MRKIEPVLTPEIQQHTGTLPVGKASPLYIPTYRRLVEQVAHLSFLNKDYLLFFRGQDRDYLNKAGVSTFYPSLYREDRLRREEVAYRFRLLEQAARRLVELFSENNISGSEEVRRKAYVQWSILQHYEVCRTPLLDFTHSLNVACSFALQHEKADEGFVYIFGLPYLTNRITVNSEHDIVNVRLLSICPPDALRPYFQEGYLAGTTDISDDYEPKSELDFNNRLVAKFAIPAGRQFWGEKMNKIPHSILFPPHDRVEELCRHIETSVQQEFHAGDVGNFLMQWAKLEQSLLQQARRLEERSVSPGKAIRILSDAEILQPSQAKQLDELRRFRNTLVHEPEKVEAGSIEKHFQSTKQWLAYLQENKE